MAGAWRSSEEMEEGGFLHVCYRGSMAGTLLFGAQACAAGGEIGDELVRHGACDLLSRKYETIGVPTAVRVASAYPS